MQGKVNMLNEIIAFAYAAVTTLLAFYIYKKHYIKIKSKPFGLRTLAFIPLTLTYIIFFEIAFNSYRFFEPGFFGTASPVSHIQRHFHFYCHVLCHVTGFPENTRR